MSEREERAQQAKVVVTNVIGGRETGAADGRTMDLVDPSTGEVFGTARSLRRQAPT